MKTREEVEEHFKSIKDRYEAMGVVFDSFDTTEYDEVKTDQYCSAVIELNDNISVSFQGDLDNNYLYGGSFETKDSDRDTIICLVSKIKDALRSPELIRSEIELQAQNKITFAQEVLEVLRVESTIKRSNVKKLS